MKRNLLLMVLLCFGLGLQAQNWSQQNTNMIGTSTGVDQVSIVDSNVVWVNGYNGSGYGQFIKAHARTQNGGATWTAGTYSGFGATVKAFVLTAVSYNKAFCVALDTVTGGTASFWQTVNGGSTWTKVTGIMNNGTTTFADGVKFWNASKGFCYGDPVSGEYDIYTTNDGGTTWNDVPGANIPDPVNTPAVEYGFNGSDCAAIVPGGIGFFITNNGRVYKTTDYGTTWSVTPANPFTPTSVSYGSNKIYASSANYIICAVYTTATTVWEWKYTTDGGTTWQLFSPVSGNFYEYSMCYVPGTANGFVATSPFSTGIMGVAHSIDGGMNWIDFTDATYLQPLGTNIQCLGVSFYDAGIGWVGNYDQATSINSILKFHNPVTGIDAGVITIVQPTGTTNANSNVQVIATIKNFGTTALTSIDIAYQLTGSAPVTGTWTGSLAPGATTDYTFTTTYTGPTAATYELCAFTLLSGDIHPDNDMTCQTLQSDVGIHESSANGLILNQNYPNPANDFTTIAFSLPHAGEVVLNLMNSVGQILYTQTQAAQAGNNQITLNTAKYPAGVYFYEFEYHGSKSHKKMIIY
ncbi:MAG: T9SS type A sorting domain-containing protein [Bacteroidota bacterium]